MFLFVKKIFAVVKTVQAVIVLINHNSGGYNRTPRPAVRPAKIYLARLLPAALLRLHRPLLHWHPLSIPHSYSKFFSIFQLTRRNGVGNEASLEARLYPPVKG